MRMIDKTQIAQIHAILAKSGLMDDKPKIIAEISQGRTESTTQLYWQEAQNWIAAMNKASSGQRKEEKPKPGQKMINSLIAMGREMGVIRRRQVVTPNGLEWKSDYTEFNKWLKEKSCVKKPLNECDMKELNNLVTQYKAIYADWLRKYH